MAEPLPSCSPLTALLGPTNTGKTHRAIERMLEHPTGMIGLPLRLLAREVYDRVMVRVGERAVALVTGEEKRVPPRPRYWVCTVEAMPTGREVDFVGVDEIQLCAHPERGHVFTARLLHARGRVETWFMGAATVHSLVERLVPTAQIQALPRLSRLRYAGQSSLGKLPPRSAVVAFSAPQVYELAERLRLRKGGAAVVLGALSPRTRNAQVAMYQAGEVDYLVATDAIGMGLNMNVEHVALAALHKFDGKETRPLETAELAQIAGRAGRYHTDGTFGTLEPLGPLPVTMARALEQHSFPSERQAVWRNSELDTATLDGLVASLGKRAPRPELRLVAWAIDAECLRYLARSPEIRRLTSHPEAVALLWEVCQIPNFGNFLVEHHCQLLSEVFVSLTTGRAHLDPDWIERRIVRLDRTEGDLDTLLARLESIRTWAYICHHSRWVERAAEWQAKTERIEQRLSDALHERLIERFVAKGRTRLARAIEPKQLAGERFHGLASLRAFCEDQRMRTGAETSDFGEGLAEAAHAELLLGPMGTISFQGQVIGQLTAGKDFLHPEVRLLDGRVLLAGTRLRVERRLLAFVRDLVDEVVGPLRGPECRTLSAAGRGLAYQLEQGLGSVETRSARPQVDALTPGDRAFFSRLGVTLGERVIYLGRALRPRALVIREVLWATSHARTPKSSARHGLSFVPDPGLARAAYLSLGYLVVGPRAIRVDQLLGIEQRLQELAQHRPFALPKKLCQRLGCSARELGKVMVALGYRRRPDGMFTRRGARREAARGANLAGDGPASKVAPIG